MTGRASPEATQQLLQRFPDAGTGHFRRLQEVWVSSIGIGTYLGDADDATDALYSEALTVAVSGGCNLIDTAINYRCQRSERTIGSTVEQLIAAGRISREELVLCTKGGYLPFDGAVPNDPARHIIETVINAGLASHDELVGGCHCLAPSYLAHAFQTSLRNLRVESVDLYYLHNPEQQLDEVSREVFQQRITAAFEWLEQQAAQGRLRWYGLATWNGFRVNSSSRAYVSLEECVQMARRIGGDSHHFRAIQLPYNLAMPEAASFRNQVVEGRSMTVLEAAEQLGISVMVSASLLQGQLAQIAASLDAHVPGLRTNAQRALQFVRSTPGVTASLVGMKDPSHARENLEVARTPLLEPARLEALYTRARRA